MFFFLLCKKENNVFKHVDNKFEGLKEINSCVNEKC